METFSLWLAAGAVAGLILTLCWWIQARREHLKLWARRGIPGPPANLLFGNSLDYLWARSPNEAQKGWLANYSFNRSTHQSTVGFFLGGLPAICTTDTDLLKAVFQRDSHHFADRQRIVPDSNPAMEQTVNDSIIFCHPERWTVMRHTLNKSFTPFKLAGCIPLIESAIKDGLVTQMDESAVSGVPLEMKSTFRRFASNIMLRYVFGIDDASLQPQHHADFLAAVNQASRNELRDPYTVMVIIFPGLARVCEALSGPTYAALAWLTRNTSRWLPFGFISNFLKPIVRQRDAAGATSQSNADILQSMMGSRNELSIEEIISTATITYAAGFESTASTLAFLMHYICVSRPDLQEEIRREIQNLPKHEYQAVMNKLPLLDACLKETLRLHTVVPQFVARDALRDYHYRAPDRNRMGTTPSFIIPKGTTVLAAVSQLHHDPIYWESPETFRPERFLPDPITGERPQITSMTYMPFGEGPRHCVGQRFAELTTKLTVVWLLSHFQFMRCDKTVDCQPGGIVEGNERKFIVEPAHGVWLRVETL